METRGIGSLDATVVGVGCNNFGWRIDADATAAVGDADLGSANHASCWSRNRVWAAGAVV